MPIKSTTTTEGGETGKKKEKKKRRGKLHRTAKAIVEAEVYDNNKKCD